MHTFHIESSRVAVQERVKKPLPDSIKDNIEPTHDSRSTLRHAAGAIFWRSLGVREKDAANVTPLQVLGAALVGVSLFELTLVAILRLFGPDV